LGDPSKSLNQPPATDPPRRPSPAPPPANGALRALRSRNFAILWFGNLLSNTGTWMQNVAEPWLVLRLSNSPFLVGLDAFMTDAPVWGLILVGGLLADRRDRRRTALFFQGIQVLCPVLIVLLLVTGRIRVWMVIAISLAVGVTDALSGPSINALVPSTVPEEDVASAVALNSAQFNLSRVLGPFFAGTVMATLGPVVCFALNASSYAPYLLSIYLLRIPAMAAARRADVGGSRRARARASIVAAFWAIARRRRLRRAFLTVMLTSVFCMPMVTFLPVLVRDAFHLGSAEFGGTLSVFGFGGLLGAAIVMPLETNRQRQILSNLAALGLSAVVVGMAVDHLFPLLLGLVFLAGGAMVASNTAANSILQSSIDARIRGRVSSIYTLAVRGGAPIGALMTGAAASRWGVRVALLANGLLALACHAALIRRARRRARAGRLTRPPRREEAR
jgi:predicted MFS family arabinose efflux permease